MTHPSPDFLIEIAQRCAEAARNAILPHFRTQLAIISKEDDSPVTRADREAENAMRAILNQTFPDHSVLGEEHGTTGLPDAEWLWILDPIDGTRSFVTGRPSFTTLIALFHKGKPLLGIIDQPITQERWIGFEGRATRYHSTTIPGTIGTNPCTSLAEADLSATAPEIFRPANWAAFQNLQKHTRRTSWGGDAYAYGLLALGHINLIAEDTLKPWDWAALVPIIEGAGGVIRDWSGAPLSLESNGTVLACGTASLLEEACHALS